MFRKSKDNQHFDTLEYFANVSKDRDQPPYFAGRRHILSDIENACENIWRCRNSSRVNAPLGQTRVIFGAPGAGKSSTLLQLRDKWNDGRYATNDRNGIKRTSPVPVMLYSGGGNIFDDLEVFCRELVDVAKPGMQDKMPTAISETVRATGEIDAVAVKGGVESERTTALHIASASLREVVRIAPGYQWCRPVVIGVDEAQTVTGNSASPTGKMLKDIHANSFNLPVVVVLSGLSDTLQRAAELGLSRLSDDCIHSLGCLNATELEDLIQGFCGYFEIDLGVHARRFKDLIERTEGWPCHIQNALLAFARVYVATGCDIDAVDFTEVEEQSQASRLRYYQSRMSRSMEFAAPLVGAIMQKVTGHQEVHQVIRIINSTARQHQELYGDSEGLPRGITAEDFYDELIHQGALQRQDDGTVDCPIPSFRGHLIEKLLKHHQQELSRDASRYRELPDAIPANGFLNEDKPYVH